MGGRGNHRVSQRSREDQVARRNSGRWSCSDTDSASIQDAVRTVGVIVNGTGWIRWNRVRGTVDDRLQQEHKPRVSLRQTDEFTSLHIVFERWVECTQEAQAVCRVLMQRRL